MGLAHGTDGLAVSRAGTASIASAGFEQDIVPGFAVSNPSRRTSETFMAVQAPSRHDPSCSDDRRPSRPAISVSLIGALKYVLALTGSCTRLSPAGAGLTCSHV